ncbi:MAG: 1-acyl-sn-glycerol-3-phosphate acyltransferase [Pirellula sp.]|jgi:1-acyl-sn-glycerol-3-phosphate acyltransferase|nr:1-acyl-sn-glycerol-3-phosphate acyltransferase [Pirellula sp.]
MQDIIIEKPYQFVPPHRGSWLPWTILKLGLVKRHLRKAEGVVSVRLHGIDHLKESKRRGHGILLAPNHCRYADPLVMSFVAEEAQTLFYAMASWHLFEQSRFQRWAISTMGAFSVYREGLDRQSLDLAVDILSGTERPLVVFPEGTVFRTNDRLQPLLDGVAFMARTAAKRRAKEGDGKVVIHPVAIKYVFHGDLEKAVDPTLDALEKRLTWLKLKETPLLQRIYRIMKAMLSLKEIEYLGSSQTGTFEERQQRLIDHLLSPLEVEWLGKACSENGLIPRIKSLRMKIVPELATGEITESERERRWIQLSQIYLAQQIASYPADYLVAPTTDTRILETIERLEEDLTDRANVHGPLEAIIEIDEAIEVPTDRAPRGEEDPVMKRLRERLQSMLDRLSSEANSIP